MLLCGITNVIVLHTVISLYVFIFLHILENEFVSQKSNTCSYFVSETGRCIWFFFFFLFFYLSLLSYNLRIGETTQLPQGHNTLETFERNSIVNVQHFLNLNSSLGQGLSS